MNITLDPWMVYLPYMYHKKNSYSAIHVSKYTVPPMDPMDLGIHNLLPPLRWGGVVAEDGLKQLDMTGPFGHLQRKVGRPGRGRGHLDGARPGSAGIEG